MTPTHSYLHTNTYTQTHHTHILTHTDICTHHTGSDISHIIHIHTFPHPYIPTVTHIPRLSHTTGHSHLCTHNPLSHTHLHICESGKVIYCFLRLPHFLGVRFKLLGLALGTWLPRGIPTCLCSPSFSYTSLSAVSIRSPVRDLVGGQGGYEMDA